MLTLWQPPPKRKMNENLNRRCRSLIMWIKPVRDMAGHACGTVIVSYNKSVANKAAIAALSQKPLGWGCLSIRLLLACVEPKTMALCLLNRAESHSTWPSLPLEVSLSLSLSFLWYKSVFSANTSSYSLCTHGHTETVLHIKGTQKKSTD